MYLATYLNRQSTTFLNPRIQCSVMSNLAKKSWHTEQHRGLGGSGWRTFEMNVNEQAWTGLVISLEIFRWSSPNCNKNWEVDWILIFLVVFREILKRRKFVVGFTPPKKVGQPKILRFWMFSLKGFPFYQDTLGSDTSASTTRRSTNAGLDVRLSCG